ncbi:hypothetical protein FACS1894191_0880 [Clostridia bacterium]|nr:hypothetical protein FACS1894191_0880 [Clostridia bacterium]
MSIKRILLVASAIMVVVCVLAQFAVFQIARGRMDTQTLTMTDGLRERDSERSQAEISALADALALHLTDIEDTIDDSMYHAALVLQTLDTHTEVTQKDMEALLREVRVNDLYLTDMDGKFTVSTVPGAVGGIGLFDIWDGYRMLVTGEATELPSTIKIMVETGQIYKFTALPRYDADGNIKGALESALEVSTIEKDIAKMVDSYTMLNSLHLFDPSGLTLASVEKSAARGRFAKGSSVSLPDIASALKAGTLLNTPGDGSITYYQVIERQGGPAYVMRLELEAAYYDENTDYTLTAVDILSSDAGGHLLIAVLIGMAFLAAVAVFYIILVNRSVLRPIAALREVTKRVSLGDIAPVNVSPKQDEVGELERDFAAMVAIIHRQAEFLGEIAQGNYTFSVPVRSEKDIMNVAINDMVNSSSGMISEIRVSASQVASGSQQIAQASQNLATGASEQAATIEEFSASITEIQSLADENAKVAAEAMEHTRDAERLMGECTDAMDQMLTAMHSIDDSSKDISKVIKVIDDIAFQTNILALNAAVEAARAGQHGKGFAVVADEVRNLASKSAEAARETADLIAGSSRSVAEGSAIVDKVNGSLQAVSSISQQNAASIASLRATSAQQSESMAEVSSSITQLSSVVQANSATAEETAASSEEMSAQSAVLDQIVSRFRLKDGANGLAASPAGPQPYFQRDASDGFALRSGDKY